VITALDENSSQAASSNLAETSRLSPASPSFPQLPHNGDVRENPARRDDHSHGSVANAEFECVMASRRGPNSGNVPSVTHRQPIVMLYAAGETSSLFCETAAPGKREQIGTKCLPVVEQYVYVLCGSRIKCFLNAGGVWRHGRE
jgi:hypothetical protein